MYSPPHVAIVLLNYNNLDFLKANLPSVSAITYSNHRVYLIDNGSTDESVAFVQKFYPSVTVLLLGQNKGYAEGYNEGLASIESDYYVLLNTDVQVTPGFIEPVINLMEKRGQIAVCQPKILTIGQTDLFEYAGGSGGYIDRLGYTFARGRFGDHLEQDKGQYDDARPVFWASGACFFIKSTVFRELGGFYPFYFMYCEEVDLCWRAQSSGYEVYVCPASVVYHRATGPMRKRNGKQIFYLFRNSLTMVHRNQPQGARVQMVVMRILFNCAAFFSFLLRGHIKLSMAVAKAHVGYLQWLVSEKKQVANAKRDLRKMPTVYKGLMLVDLYFRKIRTFKDFTKLRQ